MPNDASPPLRPNSIVVVGHPSTERLLVFRVLRFQHQVGNDLIAEQLCLAVHHELFDAVELDTLNNEIRWMPVRQRILFREEERHAIHYAHSGTHFIIMTGRIPAVSFLARLQAQATWADTRKHASVKAPCTPSRTTLISGEKFETSARGSTSASTAKPNIARLNSNCIANRLSNFVGLAVDLCNQFADQSQFQAARFTGHKVAREVDHAIARRPSTQHVFQGKH
ncbi:hypothetical protein PAERUG_P40_Scotland_4_VIM_2_09_12_04011 [Pseudomonas aeruginosa]|nr:hypothetical protein PAERUG_P40_Scotland_4_VIM_2_09_12_04011 [Pseudomonas aeruginosa]